ncbi:alternative oxidase-domain-containing protein [Dichotomocladium elegans]|nr:alternative oxidase-domain-containing protein [Dichotomocladium elegans]
MIRAIVPRSLLRNVRPASSILMANYRPSRYYQTTSTTASDIPEDLLYEIQSTHPRPMRSEFMGDKKLSSVELEALDIGIDKHREPKSFSDRFAYRLVKTLRLLPDTYFRNDYYMRAVMLETIAAVPGMVGGMLRHMRSLRRLSEDQGWIIHLLHEAENERMHLMVWMKLLRPSFLNRLLVLGAQGIFFNSYFMLYTFSPKTAHRMCGYLEEEAVISYTHFLNAIDNGELPNGPAPEIAIEYYNLLPQATVRDVVLAVRADEALHRDANHHFSDRIAAKREDIVGDILAEQHKVKNAEATKSL